MDIQSSRGVYIM